MNLVDLSYEYIITFYFFAYTVKSAGCGGAFLACRYVLEKVLMTAAWLNGA